MRIVFVWINIILRAIVEFGVIIAFALWGYSIGDHILTKIVCSAVVPILVFSFWGFFDFRNLVSNPEPFRFVQETLICGIAVWTLFRAEYQIIAIIMLTLSILHYVLVYVLGQRLIKKP